jgi:hypothetical protein
MKRGALLLAALLCCMFVSGCEKGDGTGGGVSSKEPTQEALAGLAQCLSEKGVVMYGSFTCSACRAQRKMFGPAFSHIKEIECNPNAPNTHVERCMKKKIQKTPTWIMGKGDEEIKRIEGYQLPNDLASFAGCKL